MAVTVLPPELQTNAVLKSSDPVAAVSIPFGRVPTPMRSVIVLSTALTLTTSLPFGGATATAPRTNLRRPLLFVRLIWSVAEQIEKLSEAFELKAGDIILSGTPENVGAVVKGDTLVAKIKGFPDLTIKIV